MCKCLTCEDISALHPTILTGNDIRGDAVLIWMIRMGAMDKKGANDLAWPFAAVKWDGIAPEVPTIGAAESQLRSEYLQGSLWKMLKCD
jgi:hypothetical protein